jgi:hypothetical protein
MIMTIITIFTPPTKAIIGMPVMTAATRRR